MKKVTLWYGLDHEAEKWTFNHLEDGKSDRKKPFPRFKSQSVWNEMQWIKGFGTIDSNQKVRETLIPPELYDNQFEGKRYSRTLRAIPFRKRTGSCIVPGCKSTTVTRHHVNPKTDQSVKRGNGN